MMYTLKNWYFEKKKDIYRVWGNVYDHPRFQQGQWICSSSLKEIVLGKESLIMKTGHSEYEACFLDHQCCDARILKRALHDYLWPDDEGIYARIMHGHKEDTEKEMQYSTCAVLVFEKGIKELILRRRNQERIITSYDVHKGLFQDVTELSDPRLDFCYRFFSFQKDHYQFEAWNEKYSPVFLENQGNDPIYVSTVYGDFEVKPGKRCMLDADNRSDRLRLDQKKISYTETTVLSHESMKLQKD